MAGFEPGANDLGGGLVSDTPERSGWRDQAYSDWHRQLQFRRETLDVGADKYYMLDLDVIEYRHGKEAVAFIELKHGEGATSSESQLQVLLDLARRAAVPLFQVNYRYEMGAAATPPRDAGNGNIVTWDKWDTWEFKIVARNDRARRKLNGHDETDWLPEYRYIRFLGQL